MSKICNCSKCCYIRSEWMVWFQRNPWFKVDLYTGLQQDIWRNPGAHRGRERE